MNREPSIVENRMPNTLAKVTFASHSFPLLNLHSADVSKVLVLNNLDLNNLNPVKSLSPIRLMQFQSGIENPLTERANPQPIKNDDAELELIFHGLAKQWRKETGHYSVIARRYQNPAYRKILELRPPATKLILEELRRNPDRWFDALQKLTNENPAKNAVNFYEAVDNWISWGISKGLIK